ncbi:hypothetical protein PVK06_038744 [Gossypium arboreum]|uniref:Reverse transcriptase n=1 Tax=Gossypium arboreum TaxID=29729 RepID=A0ABR0N0Z0_GOSAR|nr:hypothetical protein PVK06_038744 [Gossypium arboreum]
MERKRFGDFNEITNSFEKKGGRLRSERQKNAFRMALEDCSLNDLGYVGRCFQVEHFSHSFSDHCPILLDTMKKSGNCLCISDKMFRFEAKWCLDSSFEGLVKRLWNDTSGSIPKKLKRLGHQLQRWSTSRFKEDRRNRVELEDRLEFLFNQKPS